MPKIQTTFFVAAMFLTPHVALGQQTTETEFTSENAILDTAVPFAIGAREARLDLRNAFGWPTFQEGLVEGVYFRFDPDGYARFSPNPRLDSDVFEVLCRPRTYSCLARKDDLQIYLNDDNKLQIEHSSILPGDTLHLVDGISEIQVPDRILQPLDQSLESILQSGEELVIRRSGNEVVNVSLRGFFAVTSYLRWIAARQDYSILPRGWPVPNSQASDAVLLTETELWRSRQGTPTAIQGAPEVDPALEVLEAELEALRQSIDPPAAPVDAQLPTTIAELQAAAAQLQAQIFQMQSLNARAETRALAGSSFDNAGVDPRFPQNAKPDDGLYAVQPALPNPSLAPQTAPMDQTSNEADQLAQRLQFLMNEIGLDAKTAMLLLNVDKQNDTTVMPAASTLFPMGETDAVSQILQELEAGLDVPMAQDQLSDTMALAEEMPVEIPSGEYQLLTEYFRSVLPHSSIQN